MTTRTSSGHRKLILLAASVATAGAAIAFGAHIPEAHSAEQADTRTLLRGAPGEPQVSDAPVVNDSRHVAMPLDRYKTSEKDLRLLSHAREAAANKCMRDLGFKNWKDGTVQLSKPGDYKAVDIIGYLDPAVAARSGYPDIMVDKGSDGGPASAKAAGRQPHGTKAQINAFHQQMSAYEGMHPKNTRTPSGKAVPKGGCLDVGYSQVTPASDRPGADARRLATLAMVAALHDSRMRKAFGLWSGCMAHQGFHYTSPMSASVDPRWGTRVATAPASAAERRVASADARCRQEINLVGVYQAVEIAYQQRLLKANQGELTRAVTVREQSLKRAQLLSTRG